MYVKHFHKKAVDCYDRVADDVLVFCLHGVIRKRPSISQELIFLFIFATDESNEASY